MSASTSTYHVDRENVSCGGYIGSVIGFVLARVKEDIEEIFNEGVVTGEEMVGLDVGKTGWAEAGWLTGSFLLRTRYRMHSAIS